MFNRKNIFPFLMVGYLLTLTAEAQERTSSKTELKDSLSPTDASALVLKTNEVKKNSQPNWKPKKYAQVLLPKEQNFKNDFFRNILLSYSVENLLENLYPLATYQLPAMGDYSYPDNYLFSLLGNSWQWNKYYFNGININDLFFTGRTLHKTPMYSKNLTIDAIESRLDITTLNQEKISYFQGILGYLGGHVPMYRFLNDPYSLQSPQLRERPPTEERKRNLFKIDLYQKEVILFNQDFAFWLDAFVTVGMRNILDFDYQGNHSLFKESYFQATITAEIERPDRTFPYGLLMSYLSRDQLYSEFYYHPQETADYDHFALTIYYRSPVDLFTHQHGLNFSYKKIKKHHENFSRNLFDITGEGLDPFYPSVNLFELAEHSHLTYRLNAYKPGFLQIEADFNHGLVIVNPIHEAYHHPIYFQSPQDFLSLYLIQWESKSFSYLIIENNLTIKLNQIAKQGFSLDGKFGFDLDGLILRNDESFIYFSPHFELGIDLLKMNRQPYRQNLRLELGRKNLPFTSEFALFLSDEYQSGRRYPWNDRNQNLLAEPEEIDQTQLHSTTGGAYHRMDPHFRQPHYYYLDLPYTLDFTSDWSFSIMAHYRIFKDQAWVKLEESSGQYSNINGQKIYYPQPGIKKYQVYNLPPDRFPAEGRNWFNDSPFYLGFTLGFTGEGEKYFFNIYFSAFLVNGITTFGNGPLHNSQGILSELMADPNQKHKSLGRLDSDRGYMGNLLFTYFFLPQFTASVNIKYRDGQPIGKWEYYLDQKNRNVSFLRKNVSGDNILLYGGEFGTREDALWTVDLKFKYIWMIRENPLELVLGIYNLLDFGRELVEYSFYPPPITDRNALELQVPRGMSLAVEYRY